MTLIRKIDNGIIEVALTHQTLKQATEAIQKNYVNNHRSILKGKGNFHGALGEMVFKHTFTSAKKVESYDYDFIWQGRRVEIKTKSANTPPTENMDISVPVYSLEKQDCDSYVFVRILNDLSKAWILGGITKDAFIERSVLYKKGFKDLNGYVFLWDAKVMKIGQLRGLYDYL